ncbi:hypothetical protein QS257_11865 [Terrilactibacillus sp. S3-3]|nr:hypothetical protein QS257_11865 [Terrilactibacillus sp. S3-3]
MIAYSVNLLFIYSAVGLVMGWMLTMVPFPRKNKKHRVAALAALLVFWLPLACLTLAIAPLMTMDSFRAHF